MDEYVISKLVSQLVSDIFLYLLKLPSLTSPSLVLASIGVSAGLQPLIPVSFKRSKMYFRCETTIPFFDLAISIPRKYFS